MALEIKILFCVNIKSVSLAVITYDYYLLLYRVCHVDITYCHMLLSIVASVLSHSYQSSHSMTFRATVYVASWLQIAWVMLH